LSIAIDDPNLSVRGPDGRERFSSPADLASATPDQFSFCYGDDALPRILDSRAGMVICPKELEEKAASLPLDKTLVFVPDPRLVFARILRGLFSNVPPKITLGKNTRIHESVILGTDGYGFVVEDDGRRVRFPCVGGVRIEDNVEIDAGSVVDRGTLGDTVIGYNTKVGKLVMIGHNSQIGRSCVIATHANISGSTTIGDDVWIAPGVVTSGHVNIREGALIGTGAVVVGDIRPGWIAYGIPAKEIRQRTNEGRL